ncbi:MAG: DUF427 domain-containing protein [Thermoleophilia bacterium]|nr:DUF427 domain-containing protein [Thermoleophilia bacterium]
MWEYPRPPRLEPVDAEIEVWLAGERIAYSVDAVRVLETSHPPTIYLPPGAFTAGVLVPSGGMTTLCEWKGSACYFDVVASGQLAARAAWSYAHPRAEFAGLAEHIAVYPGRMQRCVIDGVDVTPQEGDFYGGWVTPNIHGKLKGGPGTRGW